ncbi:hypothetical protein ACFV9P_28100 [Streptomyces sp. NPDC059892]|uniref:hypothetical protein n=1 Tax=Streptomyces sp. NPDC059892 TaxID=3346989 RepID=UPI00366834A4
MFLVYQPEGADEPKRWRYDPKKLMSVEREDIERRTERNFAQFVTDVIQGNSLCRRALLFTFLRREHPTTRFEDVNFLWDELELEYSRQEWERMREAVLDTQHGDQLAASLTLIDRELQTAFDDVAEEGKAPPPTAD